jgi:16S rRNA processing protein RimM
LALPSDLIPIGYITGAFGLGGACHFKTLNSNSETLDAGLEVYLTFATGIKPKSPRSAIVEGLEQGGDIVYFEGVHDRDAALALKGATVNARRAHLPELGQGELYLVDLIGFAAKTLSGELIGTVEGFSTNSAQPLAHIKREDKATALVPFVEPVLAQIDAANRTVVLDVPEGLLDVEK